MAIHYRTRGFVIKKTVRGEADQVFTIYTENFGKLEISGKAVRKIKSKLRGGIELFYLSEIEFIHGKKIKTLTDAIAIDIFPNIRKKLKKLAAASKIAENLNDLVRGQEPDKEIWELLSETLNRLDAEHKARNARDIIYYYFLWNLFSILGYRPEFKDCLMNGQKIEGDIVKILKLILRKDWPILSRLKIEPFHQKLLKSVSRDYLNEILDKN